MGKREKCERLLVKSFPVAEKMKNIVGHSLQSQFHVLELTVVLDASILATVWLVWFQIPVMAVFARQYRDQAHVNIRTSVTALEPTVVSVSLITEQKLTENQCQMSSCYDTWAPLCIVECCPRCRSMCAYIMLVAAHTTTVIVARVWCIQLASAGWTNHVVCDQSSGAVVKRVISSPSVVIHEGTLSRIQLYYRAHLLGAELG